jgi:hypothetical protein
LCNNIITGFSVWTPLLFFAGVIVTRTNAHASARAHTAGQRFLEAPEQPELSLQQSLFHFQLRSTDVRRTAELLRARVLTVRESHVLSVL